MGRHTQAAAGMQYVRVGTQAAVMFTHAMQLDAQLALLHIHKGCGAGLLGGGTHTAKQTHEQQQVADSTDSSRQTTASCDLDCGRKHTQCSVLPLLRRARTHTHTHLTGPGSSHAAHCMHTLSQMLRAAARLGTASGVLTLAADPKRRA
jgi:hypothetical protein